MQFQWLSQYSPQRRRCAKCVRQRVVRAFLIEEQKIVKQMMIEKQKKTK